MAARELQELLMKYFLFAILMLLVISCSSPFVLMANPKTGETAECSGVGIGVIRAIAVSHQVDNCVTQYQALGYVRADQLTDEQRATLNLRSPVQQHRTVAEPPAQAVIRPSQCTTTSLGNIASTNCY